MHHHPPHQMTAAAPVHRHGQAVEASDDAPMSTYLRSATHAEHVALEAAPGMQTLMSTTLTLEDYRRWMTAWARCWLPLEAAVQAHVPPEYPAGLIPAQHGHLLHADLQALGLSVASTTEPLALPEMNGAQWLGAAYLLRGSQLGATVVAAHLDRHLQLAGAGASFFQARPQDGTSVASSFRDWCDTLNTLALDPAQRAFAVKAAQQSFQFLQRHFAETA